VRWRLDYQSKKGTVTQAKGIPAEREPVTVDTFATLANNTGTPKELLGSLFKSLFSKREEMRESATPTSIMLEKFPTLRTPEFLIMELSLIKEDDVEAAWSQLHDKLMDHLGTPTFSAAVKELLKRAGSRAKNPEETVVRPGPPTLNARLSKEDVAPILWHHPTQSVLTFEGLTVPLTCHPKEAPLVLMAVYYAFDIKVPEKASPALSFLFRLLGLRNPGNLSPKLQALYDELQE